MTITKCRPTKVQCSHSPGSLLSETQDKALDVGHCCNQKNNVNSVLDGLFDAFPQNAFHFSLSLSPLTDWRTGCCWRMIHATVRHTCKAKSRGKLQFRNRHFVNSGVRSLPTPHPHQNNCGDPSPPPPPRRRTRSCSECDDLWQASLPSSPTKQIQVLPSRCVAPSPMRGSPQHER